MAAVVVLNPAHAQTGKGGKTWGVMDMRRALKDKLANYKIPQELKAVDELPKNAMGKSMYSEPLCSFTLTSSKSIRKAWSRRYLEIKLDSAALSEGYIVRFLYSSDHYEIPSIANQPRLTEPRFKE